MNNTFPTTYDVLSEGLRFPEGPAIGRDGDLYVVELAGGSVTHIGADGTPNVFAQMGGSPNGLAIGPDDRFYVCNGGARWAAEKSTDGKEGPADEDSLIQVLNADGSFETLVSEIDGVKLNSPNDLCFAPDGSFWFTDPIWPTMVVQPLVVEPGSVCWATTDGQAKRAHTGMLFPNGLAVSEDGSTLYVAESGTGNVLQFPITGPGELGEPSLFAVLGQGIIPDGMCFDVQGRLIVAGHGAGALFVFDTDGSLVTKITVEDKDPTNVCFLPGDEPTIVVTESDAGRLTVWSWPCGPQVLFPDR